MMNLKFKPDLEPKTPPKFTSIQPAEEAMDIELMSLEARGAMYGLMLHYLHRGGLPDDEKKIMMIAKVPSRKWLKIRNELLGVFTPDWRNHRWDQAVAHVKDRRMKASRQDSPARKLAGSRQRHLMSTVKRCHFS